MLSTSTVKRRKSWLLAASALVSSSLGVSEPTLAQTCTPAQPNPDPTTGIATCTGTFNSSIIYGPGLATQLHVILDPTVNVTLPVPGIAVALNNFGNSVPVLLEANGATINVLNPAAGDHRGLYVETQANNATIMASGQIDVAGVPNPGSHAIKAFVNGNAGPGDASVTYTGAGLLPFDLRSSGTNSTVIQAESLFGNAHIDASGNMSSSGNSNDFFFGLFAQRGQPASASRYPILATHL